MMAVTTSHSDQLQLLYNVPWRWGIRNDCNVLLLEPPVCNSQHSTLREPERCWLCEPESSMALIRSKGDLCALSSPMVTWITVSHPPPLAPCGLLIPPTLLTRQSNLGCDSMEPKPRDWCGQLPFTAGWNLSKAGSLYTWCDALCHHVHTSFPQCQSSALTWQSSQKSQTVRIADRHWFLERCTVIPLHREWLQ